MKFVARDRTGYSTVATFETQQAADLYLRSVARHNAECPEDQIAVSVARDEREPATIFGSAPRGYAMASAFIRR